MDILAVLPLGFLLGMGHALEADHLIAVTALQNKGSTALRISARGAAWGIGHTLSLFAVCISMFILGVQISNRLEAQLEFCVGIMIAGLGAHVLWRLRRDRIHLHSHEHDGHRHIHLHSHAGEILMHQNSTHDHTHKHNILPEYKATLVGMVHGLAGSAGLLVLLSARADSLSQALAYLAVFGLGTILGMALLTLVISFPLLRFPWLKNVMPTTISMIIGIIAVGLGGKIAAENFSNIFKLG